MVKFLRHNKIASIILAIIRIYLGVLWTMAGWEKITGGAAGADRPAYRAQERAYSRSAGDE